MTTVQFVEELIKLAKDIRAEIEREDKDGLTEDEIAFYAALTENDNVVDAIGGDKLQLIAYELRRYLKM